MRKNCAQHYGPRVSNFLSHRIVTSLTFRIYGKLKFQCTRNGPQNPPFCPGSIQDTFIIYSSIYHQHLFQKKNPRNCFRHQFGLFRIPPAFVVVKTMKIYWAPVSEPGFLDFRISRFPMIAIVLQHVFGKSGCELSRGNKNASWIDPGQNGGF